MSNLQVRWMRDRDRSEVIRIENLCFEFPWPSDEFSRTLRRTDTIGYTALLGDQVVGFCIMAIRADHLGIANLAVMPAFQRRGIGRALVEKIAAKTSDKRPRVMACVRETNLDALLFLRAMGFKAISIMREHYDDTDEDAILMNWKQPAAKLAGVERG